MKHRSSLSARLARTAVISALALCGLADSSLAQVARTKVVGYLPTTRDTKAVMDRTDLTKLTHLNIAFANPTPAGSFLNGSDPACMRNNPTATNINYVVQKARAAGVKVSVSIGGGSVPPCSGNWATLLQPAARAATVNNLKQFVDTFALDGVDVDIEGALLNSIDTAGNFTPFIQALRAAMPGKLITAATASYNGGMVPISSLPFFDFVSIMSYDTVGPGWGTVGVEHAPYSKAESNIATWEARGLPKEKLVLGVPFYGYGFNGYASAYNFKDIVNQFGAEAAQKDVIGTLCASCGYITYNGIPTITAKTRLAIQRGAGVMIWEIGQDIAGQYSLLTAIDTAIANAVVVYSNFITASGPSVVGTAANDLITVGALKPTLTGGAGRDQFAFDASFTGGATITDFTPGSDLINLRAVLQAAGIAAPAPLDSGHVSCVRSGVSDSLIYMDPDASGPAPRRPLLLLKNVGCASLNASSFQF